MAQVVDILFEDNDLVIVNKPRGLLVHDAPGHENEPTLVGWFQSRYPKSKAVGSVTRSGMVHRLDQDTSGVMVMAKTERAYLKLRAMFESHKEVVKTYLAVLKGKPKSKKGTITEPVEHRPAISHYEVLGFDNGKSLVEFIIETGRKHQIREHAKFMGHPVISLHAVELKFPHPITGKKLSFAAEPPREIIYP